MEHKKRSQMKIKHTQPEAQKVVDYINKQYGKKDWFFRSATGMAQDGSYDVLVFVFSPTHIPDDVKTSFMSGISGVSVHTRTLTVNTYTPKDKVIVAPEVKAAKEDKSAPITKIGKH